MRALSFTKLFYPPTALTFPSAGIDIGNQSIKFFEFAYKSSVATVKNFGRVTLAEGIVSNGDILKKDELVKALVEVKNQLSYDFVKVVVPESKTYVFDVVLPRLALSEIRQALEFKLEENVPFKADEVYFEYQVIEQTNSRTLVSVSVVPKRVLSELLDVVESAGMHSVSFEIESRIIAQSVLATHDNANAIVLYIKGTATIMFFVVNGIVRFSSTVSIGENMMRSILSKQSTSTIEHKSSSHDTFAYTEDELTNTLANVFSVLKDEVEKFYQYVLSQSQKEPSLAGSIQHLIICGRGAELPGLVRHISQNFDIKTSLANVWVNTLNLEETLPKMSFVDSLDFVAAIGIAGPTLKINYA